VIARNSNDPTPTPNSPSGEEAMVMLVSAWFPTWQKRICQ
jgi:hypothetical protein